MSIYEAEYMALTEGVQEVTHLLGIVKELGIEIQTPIEIKNNNIAAISMANNRLTIRNMLCKYISQDLIH